MKKEIPLEKSYGDDHVDDHVDKEIEDCFSTKNPKCFFVFAGAGSGKTRSLINTLNFLDREQGENLLMNGKQVAVITYTNAACRRGDSTIIYYFRIERQGVYRKKSCRNDGTRYW